MKLRHYSATPTLTPREVKQIDKPHFKPRGLWVSDDDCEDSWPRWCQKQEFEMHRLTYAFDVTLCRNAKILFASSVLDIALITRKYGAHRDFVDDLHIQWNVIASEYDGIIITPYQWGMRYDIISSWYYSWDCASGCIWNTRAIANIEISSGDIEISSETLKSAPASTQY